MLKWAVRKSRTVGGRQQLERLDGPYVWGRSAVPIDGLDGTSNVFPASKRRAIFGGTKSGAWRVFWVRRGIAGGGRGQQ